MSNDDPKSQSVNPFAQGGKAPQTPSQSFNPFASAQPKPPVPVLKSPLGSSMTSGKPGEGPLNPFAPKTPVPESTSDAPAASFNPFAAQQTGASSPLQSSQMQPAQPVAEASPTSVNPFEQGIAAPAQDSAPAMTSSLAASRLGNQDSFNVFNKTAPQATDFPAPPSDFGDADAFKGVSTATAPVAETEVGPSGYTVEEAQQIRNLAPLEFAPVEVPIQNIGDLPEIAAGFIKKKNARTITIGVGLVTLIFGLLFGFMINERRAHNARVDAWGRIDTQLVEPMQKVDELGALIQEQLDSVNKSQKIPWELNEKLPNKIARVPATILAPTVPLENLALLELSELVMKTNTLFQKIRDHRVLSEAVRLDYRQLGQKTAFGSYPEGAYAVDITEFLSRCSKRGRITCAHNAKPIARIVAIPKSKKALNKKGGSKVEVVKRYEAGQTSVKVSELVPLARMDVLGRTNPTGEYLKRLIEIKGTLDKLREMRERFKVTRDKKLSLTKVFTL